MPRPRLPNHPRQSRPQLRLRPEISSLPTQRQGHPKQSRLPQRRVRSVGLCRSLLTPMAPFGGVAAVSLPHACG